MGYKTPEPLALLVDNIIGKLIIFIIVILLFIHANPILAVLGLFVGFVLIRNSSIVTGSDAIQKFLPSETKKGCEMSAYNFSPHHQFQYTLEQEVIKNMVPSRNGSSISNPSFKPLLENDHSAAKIMTN
jgi:hypothetical protein